MISYHIISYHIISYYIVLDYKMRRAAREGRGGTPCFGQL